MAERLTEFIRERNMFIPGFVIDTGKKVTRQDMRDALLLCERLVAPETEEELQIRYELYKEFIIEIHKPEYNCLFPEPNPGFKGFTRKEGNDND